MKVIFSTNFRPKTQKIVRAVFEKYIKVSDFGLIWRPFREYLQIKDFFKNPALRVFHLYSPLTSCEKSEKSLEPLLRKLPHQPTSYYQQHRFYRTWLTPVQLVYTVYIRRPRRLLNVLCTFNLRPVSTGNSFMRSPHCYGVILRILESLSSLTFFVIQVTLTSDISG